MSHPPIDTDRIDEAVLALMYLTLHGDRDAPERAWKSFDWGAMGRLHAKGMISDPVGRAKSVVLTEPGRRQCEAAFYRLFAQRASDSTPDQSAR